MQFVLQELYVAVSHDVVVLVPWPGELLGSFESPVLMVPPSLPGQKSQHEVQNKWQAVPQPPACVHVGFGGPRVWCTLEKWESWEVVVCSLLLLVSVPVVDVTLLDELLLFGVGVELGVVSSGTEPPAGQGGGVKVLVFTGWVVPLMTVGSVMMNGVWAMLGTG